MNGLPAKQAGRQLVGNLSNQNLTEVISKPRLNIDTSNIETPFSNSDEVKPSDAEEYTSVRYDEFVNFINNQETFQTFLQFLHFLNTIYPF